MKTLVLLLFIGVSFGLNAQTQEWADYTATDGVTIQIKKADCIRPDRGTAKQYYLLKVVNSNPYDVEVNFYRIMDYGNGMNSSTSEYQTTLEIPANESKEGSCDSSKQLKVFSKMLELKGVRSLQNFELKNLTVEKKD